jgi:hypothetical protein
VKNSKIIFHVGLQKTGSTFLQDLIFPELKNVTYIGRPYTQENYAFNTLQYADSSLYNPLAIRNELDRIKEIAQGETVLISDELFSGYAFYNFINRGFIAERLSELTPDAEIILFLRNQTDIIMSLYNQYVKIGWFDGRLDNLFLYKPGEGFSLDRWLDGNKDWNIVNRFIIHRSLFSTEHFRYSNLYSLYSRLFKSVHIFLYEDFKENQKLCIERLASILSAELPSNTKFESEKIVNKRLEKHQLYTKLIRNRIMHILPNSSVIKKISLPVAILIANAVPNNIDDSNKNYVISLLTSEGIFDDNYTLNQKLGLGMEKYPKQYFGGNYSSFSESEV